MCECACVLSALPAPSRKKRVSINHQYKAKRLHVKDLEKLKLQLCVIVNKLIFRSKTDC